MATHQLSPIDYSIADKRRTTRNAIATDTTVDAMKNALKSMDAMDTALLANAYTQAQIDHMTSNDKQYALRLALDPTSV